MKLAGQMFALSLGAFFLLSEAGLRADALDNWHLRNPLPTGNPQSDGNATVSWTIPSANFTLQENSDLTTTNWTDVTSTPALNLTNLQYQTTMSRSAGNRFYRLKH